MLLKKMLRPVKRAVVEMVSHYNDRDHLEWHFMHSHRLRRFKEIHKGKSCIIIGNGPSLNAMDLAPLRTCYTFGLNKIYLIRDRVDLDLTYHVSVNPLVIEQSVEEFEALQCPTFLSYRAARRMLKSKDHIYYLMTDGETFQKDITRELDEGYTVTYVAMQIAYYMGFSRVFLIGVDHNFTASGAPNEKQVLQGQDQNHFHPDYFGNKEWHLPDLEGSELAYLAARFHYKRDGRAIYDATVGGKLQVFPKVSYEEALKSCAR